MSTSNPRKHPVITPDFHAISVATPRLFLRSRYRRSLKNSSRVDLEIRKSLLDWRIARNVSVPEVSNSGEFGKSVWTFWDKGFEEAPAIVKRCLESQALHFGKRLVVLDEKTIHDYVELPDVIVAKRNLMTTTHFTDILRLLLLRKYGGTWIDATVFVSATPANAQTNFFAFSRPHDPFLLSSWFLQADTENYVVAKWLNTLLDYWRSHDELVNYFLLHHLFEIECLLDWKFWDDWSKVPIKCFQEPHNLQKNLGTRYSEDLCKMFYKQSNVHKLTYRFDPAFVEGDTFLSRLLDIPDEKKK